MSVTECYASWFLAQLKPNSVNIAERNLRRQGFELFLPLEEVTKRVNSKFVQKTRPLFPGYIFVSLEAAQGAWRTINSTYGITKLVSFGKSPAPVPSEIVTALQTRCDASGKLVSPPALQPGDTIEVVAGPFADLIADIERIDADRRIWILLDIMGAKTKVAVPEHNLRAVS
jgi:transcriptional antiterminator RfaH